MEIKIDFAAGFWVILLSRMYPNDLQVIFLLLVRFSKVSVRYTTLFGSMLIISFYLVCTNLCDKLYDVHIFNNLLSMIRAIHIEPNVSLVKAGISKKGISKRH